MVLIKYRIVLLFFFVFFVPIKVYGLTSNLNFQNKVSKDVVVYVVIDDRSSFQIGKMPIDRDVYVNAIKKLKAFGTRAIILKFLFDRETASDSKLAASMKLIPTFLQVAINEKGTAGWDSNLISKFQRKMPEVSDTTQYLKPKYFDLPSHVISEQASGVGFGEARIANTHDKIESFAVNDKNYGVPSMTLLTSEIALGFKAIVHGQNLSIGKNIFTLDSLGRIQCSFLVAPAPKVISISDVLQEKMGKDTFKNKVVVIGYYRSDSPTVEISQSHSMKVHEYFFRQVNCLLNLSNNQKD